MNRTEPRNESIPVRYSPTERAVIENNAAALGMEVSTYIRFVSLRAEVKKIEVFTTNKEIKNNKRKITHNRIPKVIQEI